MSCLDAVDVNPGVVTLAHLGREVEIVEYFGGRHVLLDGPELAFRTLARVDRVDLVWP